MAYAITDFTHGKYAYSNDAQVANIVSMRNVYATPSGMTLATGGAAGAPVILAKHARRRYIFSQGGGANGLNLERHFPIAITQVAAPTAPGTIDGVTNWVLKGYRGEQQRA
jgi:hypothetical protein